MRHTPSSSHRIFRALTGGIIQSEPQVIEDKQVNVCYLKSNRIGAGVKM
jgi:hypothetical protein